MLLSVEHQKESDLEADKRVATFAGLYRLLHRSAQCGVMKPAFVCPKKGFPLLLRVKRSVMLLGFALDKDFAVPEISEDNGYLE